MWRITTKKRGEAPRYDELFQAFDVIEKIVKRYNLLIKTSYYTKLTPVMQGDWEELFTIPWMNRLSSSLIE